MKCKRMLASILTVAMLLAGFPAKNAEAVRFQDISGHWAYDYIVQATDLGLFSGTSDTTFSPNVTMTRAMFVTVLASCSGEKISDYSTTKFKDVPKDCWYAHAVAWAYQKGITSGTSGTAFSPNLMVTREQIAVLMVKFANYQEFVLPRSKKGILFSDSSKCSDYALDAVYTLYRAGIVSGTGNSRFDPKGNATRAETAVILCKYVDAKEKHFSDQQKVSLISHRGYNFCAPENTLPAFEFAVKKGYDMIETDVQFTKDGIPVLIHDDTIDRTSNGSGEVGKMTYKQLLNYDFSYVDGYDFSAYRGTKIMTFDEFITFCAKNKIHPFVELKQKMTASQVKELLRIATQHSMQYNTTWISFYYTNLKNVKSSSPYAPLCLLVNHVTSSYLAYADQLKNGVNTVYIGAEKSALTASLRAQCLRKKIHLCVWTIWEHNQGIIQANTSAEYITTNNLTWNDLYS
ncbi:MAG: S-layer homology domain-containing protein [Clostridia bacterium]|nr:S-layer homology domain-containing protein [Clostridia bacterium]